MKIKETLPCYVYFKSENCSGGGECIKCCPTKAIRIKHGKSIHLVDNCIGCGECISVCPLGCITPATSPTDSYEKEDMPVVFVAPVLYSQFPGVHPRRVLKALREMGFRHAVDMSWFFERYLKSTKDYILDKRKRGDLNFPVLSAMCPVVLRLIAFRFPDLIDNLHPVMRPVSILVKEALSLIAKHHNTALENISVFYLNPCPTKMDTEKSAYFCDAPYTSRAIGINHIYPKLKKYIDSPAGRDNGNFYDKIFEFESAPSVNGILLGLSGGESTGIGLEKTMSISGINETMAYLEKIEMGLFTDVDFIEFRSCREGCVGGSLCSIDKYEAKNAVHNMSRELLHRKRGVKEDLKKS